GMMEKAGYLQRTGYSAIDSEGNAHAVIELHILGTRYAIRRSDLSKAVSGRVFVQLEELTHQWQYYLGAVKGMASVSVSGKALNIDGACLFDPFSTGNVQEIMRLLAMARIPVGTVFAHDRLDNVHHASRYTIGTNEDFGSGIGEYCGGTLGFRAIEATFKRLGEVFGDVDTDRVFLEIEQQEERMVRACDKFLLRFDPPSVAIFSGFSYGLHVAETLERYLDADICCIGSRNAPGASKYPVEPVTGLDRVKSLIGQYNPDLVMGSSFERSVCDARSFSGITPPLRGTVRLTPTPFVGVHGTLSLVEQVLNTCMDKKSARP
ncbi:MAG: hypothetical protein CVV34_07055, partial [Methanomicrobiales archaeon HGW-Methanomicrobiales-5]